VRVRVGALGDGGGFFVEATVPASRRKSASRCSSRATRPRPTGRGSGWAIRRRCRETDAALADRDVGERTKATVPKG